MTPRSAPGARRLVALLGAAGALAGGCTGAPASTSASTTPALPVPLATSVQGGGATWATVPMGDLGQPLNTFWQLFVRPDGSDTWSNQVEATATATNGGIVLAGGTASLVAAVRPSQDLHYSPVVVTTDTGRSWSTGVLDPGLIDLPDSLASGGSDQALALVATARGTELMHSAGSLVRWRSVADQSQLATAAGRRCGLSGLTAVAVVGGTEVVGGTCKRPGTAGVLMDGPGGWHLEGPPLPGSLAAGSVEVLGLWPSASGVTAVLAVSGDNSTELLEAWWAAGGPWRVSAPLTLGHGARLLSLGPDGGSGSFVLIGDAGHDSLEHDSGPGAVWNAMPPPPAGTATIAFVPGSAPQALAVDHSVLTVWSLSNGGWAAAQTLDVSIPYGSSS